MDNQYNTEKKSVGPAIGLVIIVVLIVLGSVYFWNDRKSNDAANSLNNSTDSLEQSSDTRIMGEIESQSSSDELDAIDADLQSFGEANIDGLDSDL
jgi:CHASE3 domain sensor protein